MTSGGKAVLHPEGPQEPSVDAANGPTLLGNLRPALSTVPAQRYVESQQRGYGLEPAHQAHRAPNNCPH